MNAHSRPLHSPTPEEIRAACKVLLRVEPVNSEAFRVVTDRLAGDWRDHASGCLLRAREYRRWASEYPAGSARHERYTSLALGQWRDAKFAVRKYRENREH